MKFKSDYHRVSGFSLSEGCCFVGQRFDQKVGFKPRESESMLVTVKPNPKQEGDFIANLPVSTGAWITGCWMSESKAVFLSLSSDREIMRAPAALDSKLRLDSFETTPVPFSPYGIWGLNDKCVFTWGEGEDAKGKDTHPVFQFDGKSWKELPSPGFEVLSMHGIAADYIMAAGHDSSIALWDGKKWKEMDVPGPETYTCVHVVSRDEAYAVGTLNSVVEGTKHGWSKIAQGNASPAPLLAVTKWKGELWIGAGAFGLLRRIKKTNKLEVVNKKIHATSFDARKDLLIMTPDAVVATSDGKDFNGTGMGVVLKVRGDKKLNQY